MSSTTEKCREILLRLTKAIENIDVYSYKKQDDNSVKKASTPSSTQDREEQKPARINANSSVSSSSAYNLLFQTLLELRTKSYTKNQAMRAKLIHYNIIKKIFHLLCEKPDGLQAAYENYLKSIGRKKGEERQVDGGQNNSDKEGTVKEESKNGVESLARENPKNNNSMECCPQPLELEEQETVPFADFRDLLLSLLGNFCLDSAARSQVIKHRGITILRTILFEAESESIWRRCCRTLANLAVDPACRKAIQATDITAKIICILESSCDSECKSTICRTLRLFAESSQLLKTIIDCNGITILIQICRYGTYSVKGAAVKTLAELGKKNCSVEFGHQVLRGEGLVKLVEMTKEDAVYSEHALCILIYLSHHSFIRPLMGSSDVIQTLQSKFESEIPAHLCSEILNAFCLFSYEAVNRVKLRQFGILKILLSALQDQRYAPLHNRIISAFVNFLYDDSSFDLLLENGLVPVLFVHLQRCAGFSFTVPNTEPFVESLIEAVMNRKEESENSNTHGTACSNIQERSTKHTTTASSSTGKESSSEEKCPKQAKTGTSSIGKESTSEEKHTKSGSSSTVKESSSEEKCPKQAKTGTSSIGKESTSEEKHTKSGSSSTVKESSSEEKCPKQAKTGTSSIGKESTSEEKHTKSGSSSTVKESSSEEKCPKQAKTGTSSIGKESTSEEKHTKSGSSSTVKESSSEEKCPKQAKTGTSSIGKESTSEEKHTKSGSSSTVKESSSEEKCPKQAKTGTSSIGKESTSEEKHTKSGSSSTVKESSSEEKCPKQAKTGTSSIGKESTSEEKHTKSGSSSTVKESSSEEKCPKQAKTGTSSIGKESTSEEKHTKSGSSSIGKESSSEEKCPKLAKTGSSSIGKESSSEQKCTTHTVTDSSSTGKESSLEENPEPKLVNKDQSTGREKILSSSPVLVPNNNVDDSKHDPKVEEKLASSPTHKQCLSASDNPPDEDQDMPSASDNPPDEDQDMPSASDIPPDEDQDMPSARKTKNCQTAQVQKTCLPNSAYASGQLQVPSTTGRLSKRKHETEVFSEPSKRYRLSLGVEADPQKEPAILSLKVPDTHNLSSLVAETVADMVDMSPSTVFSHVGKCSERLEQHATEIVAFHDSSLLEPSQSQTMDMESNCADIFVSLRSKCSRGQIEEILKMKGFSIRTESETCDSDQEVDGDEADDNEDEDDQALEKQQRNFYCIDSPSYNNKITWQPDGYAADATLKSSSITKEITGISGQYLSPLSNASYHSPDWSPNFSSQEKVFSSEDSYSSEEEMQVDVSDRTLSYSDNYMADNNCQVSADKTSRHKKNTSLGVTKKCSKAQSSVNLVNRKTEDNILILLSRISQKENPTKYLANVESFLCLLRYIGHVPLAFPRSVRILGRVVSNLFCLESLLGFMAPALIFLELMTSWNHRICDTRCHSDMFWTPSRATWLNIGSAFSQNSCIEGSDDLLKAGQLILNEFGVVAEINFGTCLLAQHLMKETPQQNYVIACLPFLCRSHNVQEKLLVRLRGFDLLQNIVMSNPKSCLSKVVILGLSYLACHLNVKPDPIMPTPYPKCSKTKKSIKCCLKTFPKDITFVTDYGQKVFANKEQLTQQSDVFSAMLTSNFLESKSAEIAIPDISLVALRFIVHYLHGCSVKCNIIDYIVSPKSSLPFDGIVNVLAHADQYMLTKLQDFLVKIVREKYLNYQTAGKFYNVASLHNYNDLRKECLTYCLVNLVFGSKSVSCMMDILTGPYAREFLDLVKKTLKKHATIDPFAKI